MTFMTTTWGYITLHTAISSQVNIVRDSREYHLGYLDSFEEAAKKKKKKKNSTKIFPVLQKSNHASSPFDDTTLHTTGADLRAW